MIYYICLFLVLFTLYIFTAKYDSSTRKEIFLLVSFLLLSLMSGFRGIEVGTDTEQFVNSYIFYSDKGFEYVNFSQVYEPGFMLYIITLSKLGLSPRAFLLITYTFINFAFVTFIYKHSKNYFISIIIYIYSCQFLASMSMLRQFMAIAVVLLAFNNLLFKKYLRFFVAVLIAGMFHYFALGFIILIPLNMIGRIKKYMLITLIIVFIPCFLFAPQIVKFLLMNIDNYADYIQYLQDMGEFDAQWRLPPMLLVVIGLLVPFILNFSFVYGNNNFVVYKNKNYYILYWIYLGLTALVLMSARFGLITRVYYYLTPFLILAPNLVIPEKGLSNKKMFVFDWDIYYIFICLSIFLASFILDSAGTYNAMDYYFSITVNR